MVIFGEQSANWLVVGQQIEMAEWYTEDHHTEDGLNTSKSLVTRNTWVSNHAASNHEYDMNKFVFINAHKLNEHATQVGKLIWHLLWRSIHLS